MTSERLAGTTRYGTAKAIASHTAMGTPTGAIVATGENFPDALAAATLAGANGPQPIVLTETAVYTLEAKEALAALKAKFATLAVTIVGGTSAVNADVEASIKADGFTVTRVGGTDRYDTANLIARAANTRQTGGSGLVGGAKTAIFATGQNFPDALAAGPAAYRNDLPILLVTADTLPDSTKGAITALGIKNAIIVGGTTVVSAEVQAQIATATGDTTVERLAGANRNATAATIGDYEAATLSFPMSSAGLATGLNFPDALALGPFMGVQGGPIVLTASLPPESAAFLDKYSYAITKLWVSGGTAAVDDATVTAAVAEAKKVSNDQSATNAPDLLRVEAAGTNPETTGATPGGPVYRFIFDEPVTSTVTAAGFKAYTAYGDPIGGAAGVASGQAVIDPANSSAVLASWTIANRVFTDEATLFTNIAGAVRDPDGNAASEGKAAGPATRTFAAGNTRAPDLLSIAVVTGVANAETYDFTFDQASAGAAAVAGSFQMADSDGALRTASSATATAGSAVVRVAFTTQPAVGASGIRGIVLSGGYTASTTGGLSATNAGTQTANVTGRATVTDSPDLASITQNPTASTTNSFQVSFTFDEAVETLTAQGSVAGFHLVYRNNTITTATSAERSATDQRTVVASFSTGGTLNSVNEMLAGAYVDDSAVARLGSTTALKPNRAHLVGIANTFTAGSYLGPDLVSATKSNVTNLSGTVTNYRITYTFDESLGATITEATDGAGFYVTSTAGTRTQITVGLCSRPATAPTTVVCTSAGTSSATDLAIRDARLATITSGVVSSSKVRTIGDTGSTIANHEDRAPV